MAPLEPSQKIISYCNPKGHGDKYNNQDKKKNYARRQRKTCVSYNHGIKTQSELSQLMEKVNCNPREVWFPSRQTMEKPPVNCVSRARLIFQWRCEHLALQQVSWSQETYPSIIKAQLKLCDLQPLRSSPECLILSTNPEDKFGHSTQ